jgi:beta-galactosidase
VHRVQKLKDMGMNGWRTAHNAPNPALLDAADRMGFLDENHRNGQQDDELTTLVLRDRNHPTIVLWSVCNELLCETPSTDADFTRSVALFHALDPLGGRVVSSNYNPINGPDTPLDVQGKRGEEDNVLVT